MLLCTQRKTKVLPMAGLGFYQLASFRCFILSQRIYLKCLNIYYMYANFPPRIVEFGTIELKLTNVKVTYLSLNQK